MYYRLLKPNWAKPVIKREVDGKTEELPNPDFVREVDGPDTIGDEELSEEFLRQKNELGYNIYHFPNGPSAKPDHKFLNGKDIDVFKYVFVDMDLKDKIYESKEAFLGKLAEFPLLPSFVVDSGNGIHAYWEMVGLDIVTYICLQFCLIQHFNTDDSVWTPLQLMRAPGYLNTKDPNQAKPCELIPDFISGGVYTPEELEVHLPEISADNTRRLTRHLNKLNGIEEEQIDTGFNVNELPSRFLRDLETNARIADLFERPKETKGDRSSADMALTNLLYSLDYSKQEAVQVIMNSQKARQRPDKQGYAFMTVNKVYTDRPQYSVASAAERKSNGLAVRNLGQLMNGPEYWDCLQNRWRRKQVLGLIAGSGVGKTTVTLDMFKSFIQNNPDNQDIFVFFSLEMTEGEIHDRWDQLTRGDLELAKRLYVVANEDDEGNARHIGLQEIMWYCRDIEKSTGKKIAAVAVDHLDAISRHIDTTKKDTFKIEGMERLTFHGDVITISKGAICAKVKELAKKLDVFFILQSQTTKAQDGGGDIPLGKNAAYGVSNFEWYVDYIMTLWRPLKRVQDKTHLRITSWQYAKIRAQHKNDPLQENIPYLLKFDPDTGSHDQLTDEEMPFVNDLIRQANVLRKKEDKKESDSYKNSPIGTKKLARVFSLLKDQKKGAT